MDYIPLFALGAGSLGILYSLVTATWIVKQPSGSERMRQISDAIHEGATAFLSREYKTVAIVGVVLAVLL
jgi:K(+)-stimulated pyrophosphate-energized sodium pump